MTYLISALTALFSSAALFAIAKLIGYRQLSEMTVFDYVNGITIGSIAAELSVARGSEFFEWFIALVVFGGVTFAMSLLTCKSFAARKAITGMPVLLFSSGKLYPKNMMKMKIDIDEFLMLMRNQGYFDLSEVGAVLIEPNGKLSILPLAENRPITPKDTDLAVKKDEIALNVIVDGKVEKASLKALGFDETWLSRELERQGGERDAKKIFLATLTNSGTLTVFTYSDPPKMSESLE